VKTVGGTALALSGGGVRAVCFHAGVLKWLAERGELERVNYVSSVSGGSLFVGLVFHAGQLRWPSSREYLDSVFPFVRATLTESSLQSSALRRLLLVPLNWRFVFARANVVARTIEKLWGVTERLRDLPAGPVWAINGTTGETGVRFRIKGTKLGDYETGYASVPDMKIAVAMAISAAFPVGIGPLSLKARGLDWEKREKWDSDEVKKYKPSVRVLHLYDGGLYDNLGLEALFDVGNQVFRVTEGVEYDKIAVSDASPPLLRGRIPFVLSPLRAKRLIDITLAQIRRLRVRSFVSFIRKNPGRGVYIQMGQEATSAIKRLGGSESAAGARLSQMEWLSASEVERAASYKTTLRRVAARDFDLLARHGYETARWNGMLWEEKTSKT